MFIVYCYVVNPEVGRDYSRKFVGPFPTDEAARYWCIENEFTQHPPDPTIYLKTAEFPSGPLPGVAQIVHLESP